MEEQHHPTAPFGRRTLGFVHVASQPITKTCPRESAVHDRNLLRSICTARTRIGVSELTSNYQLSLNPDGMVPTRSSRRLAVLVDASLIVARDSPNDKRCAREGRAGELDTALGFNLSPFITRADEFKAFAEDIRPEERALKLVRERITTPCVFARDAKAGEKPAFPSRTFLKIFFHPHRRSRREPGQSLRAQRRFALGIANAARRALGMATQWSFDVSFLARPAPCGNAPSPPSPAKQFFAASTCCAEA
jgi:hypothetical protein